MQTETHLVLSAGAVAVLPCSGALNAGASASSVNAFRSRRASSFWAARSDWSVSLDCCPKFINCDGALPQVQGKSSELPHATTPHEVVHGTDSEPFTEVWRAQSTVRFLRPMRQGRPGNSDGAGQRDGVVQLLPEGILLGIVVAGFASALCWLGSAIASVRQTTIIISAFWDIPSVPLKPTSAQVWAVCLNGAAALFAAVAVGAQALDVRMRIR
jgi:hypothetical protein